MRISAWEVRVVGGSPALLQVMLATDNWQFEISWSPADSWKRCYDCPSTRYDSACNSADSSGLAVDPNEWARMEKLGWVEFSQELEQDLCLDSIELTD